MTDPIEEVDPIGRDQYGRPLIIPAGGGKPVPYTRCSTYAKSVSDSTAITKWRLRMMLKGLALRPDLLQSLALAPGGPQEAPNDYLDQIIEAAHEAAGGNDAAKLGTTIHALSEWVDQGVAFDVDSPAFAEFAPFVGTYKELTQGMTPLEVERFVVNDAVKVAGTYDRLVRLADGRVIVGDLKTGKMTAKNPHETAIQIATYARSMHYDPATGARTPIHEDLDTSVGLLIHVPSNRTKPGCYLLDLDAGWAAAQLAEDVRKWRTSKISTPYFADPPPF